MTTPVYLAPEFLSLPTTVARVVLDELGPLSDQLQISPVQLRHIWLAILEAQSDDPSLSALLARWAGSSASYCSAVAQQPPWQRVIDDFMDLEVHEYDFDRESVVARWRSLSAHVHELPTIDA